MDPTREIKFTEMDEESASAIAAWRYEPLYDVCNIAMTPSLRPCNLTNVAS